MTSLLIGHPTNVPNNPSFTLALQWVLAYEGDCSDDAGDPGGLTCWGITHSEYSVWRDQKGLPRQSVTQMTIAEADDIYLQNYWIKPGCFRLSPRLAIAVFDWEVNSGRGVRTLQQILGAKQTGYVDDSTLNDLKAYESSHGGEDGILDVYFSRRDSMYYSFANNGQSQFLSGWLWRSHDLRAKLSEK